MRERKLRTSTKGSRFKDFFGDLLKFCGEPSWTANVDDVKSDMALAGLCPKRQFFNVSLGIADLPNQVYRRIVKVRSKLAF